MKKGFTIIELIIVMAVIGGLASIVIFSYPASFRKARDIERQNALKTYQEALEIYAMNNDGLYPVSVLAIPIPTLCPTISMFNDECIDDPKDGVYYYQTNSSGTIYATWGSMENTSDTYITCSNGMSGLALVTPAAGVCPPFSIIPTSGPTMTLAPSNTPAVVPTNTPTPTSTTAPVNSPTPTPTATTAPPTSTPTPTVSTVQILVASVPTDTSCNARCSAVGKTCVSVGLDSQATDGNIKTKSGGGSGICTTASGKTCGYTLVNKSKICDGFNTEWTNCRCQ